MRYWLFLLLTVSAVGAATYWADNTVSSASTYDPVTRTTGSGSETVRPTVQGAVNLATSPGDIVNVRAGTYAEVVASAAAGSEGNYITHRAYNGETVEIQRWDQNSGTESHNYHWVEGFTITQPQGGDGNNAGLRVRSSYNVFTNCTIKNGSKAFGVYVTGVTNTFANNTINPGRNYVGTHDGGADQSVMTDSSLNMIPDILVGFTVFNWNDGSQGTITANTETTITATLSGGTDNNWDDGDDWVAGPHLWIVFSNGGNGSIYSGNLITNIADCERIWSFSQSDYVQIIGNRVDGMTASHATLGPHQDLFQVLNNTANTQRYITIERNWFLDCDSQGSNIENAPPYCQEWTVRGNVWKNLNSQWGPKIKASKYYNNTIYMTGGTYPFGFWNDADSEVFNNVFIGETSSALNITTTDPGAFDVNNNYYATGLSWAAWDGTYISDTLVDDAPVNGGDPMMVDPENDDFTLRAGSPLINAGRDLSAEWPDAVDMNGTPMGAGGGWDIGAFEFTTDGGGSTGGSDGGGVESPTVKAVPHRAAWRRR